MALDEFVVGEGNQSRDEDDEEEDDDLDDVSYSRSCLMRGNGDRGGEHPFYVISPKTLHHDTLLSLSSLTFY